MYQEGINSDEDIEVVSKDILNSDIFFELYLIQNDFT